MNSTLPTFLASPAAGSTLTGAAQLNADLAGLLSAPAVTGTGTGEGPVTLPADFSTLMPAVPAAAAPVITVQTTITPPTEIPPVVTVAMPVRRFTSGPMAKQPAASVTVPASDLDLVAVPTWSRGALAPVVDGTDSGARAPRLQEEALTVPSEVPQEIREQAVAFVASLLQSLLPETTLPSLPAPDSTPLGQPATAPLSASVTEIGISHAVIPLSSESATPLKFSMQNSAVGADLGPPSEDGPRSAPTQKPAFESNTSHGSAELNRPATFPLSPGGKVDAQPVPTVSPAPSFVVAEDGALEFKLTPPPVTAPARAGDFSSSGEPVEFSAELQLPGQPLVRVESSGFSAATAAPGMVAAAPGSAPEKFAAKNRTQKSARVSAPDATERNFVFSADKQVTDSAPRAGIAVAQTDTTMLAAPTEEIRAARSPQDSTVSPMRVDFQAAQPPAERITAPTAAPSGQNFAERAVDTVTGLIEAQFSASMQKSGSVQLRLKFGGEDLSVRVEIRDGTVHTDFRTDSPALRAALQHEWRAVASASPEQMQRYADPVFAPGSASSANSSSAQGDAQRQQNPQAQSDAQQRGAREAFADHPVFNRRSLVSESFSPEPVAPRVASFLPTSLRLSALA